ncbi:MAG: XrtV sorting system accessory protein [Pseudomonadota bacterium]
METIYDFLSVSLFIAAASVFFYRFRHEDPPLAPYVLISLICAVSNWLGNNGAAFGSICLMTAAAFFLLQLASMTYAEDSDES